MYLRTGSDVPTRDIKALWDKIEFSRGRDPETIRHAILNTEFFVHAWEEQRLIGTARVITDGAYYATLWDVIVDPSYQAQGVGKALVEAACAPFLNRGFSFVALFSAQAKEPFYEKLGFVRHPRGMKYQE